MRHFQVIEVVQAAFFVGSGTQFLNAGEHQGFVLKKCVPQFLHPVQVFAHLLQYMGKGNKGFDAGIPVFRFNRG